MGDDLQQNDTPRQPERQSWLLIREKILMGFGITLISATFVVTTFGVEFHFEFLLCGLALCGISIAQWGDKK